MDGNMLGGRVRESTCSAAAAPRASACASRHGAPGSRARPWSESARGARPKPAPPRRAPAPGGRGCAVRGRPRQRYTASACVTGRPDRPPPEATTTRVENLMILSFAPLCYCSSEKEKKKLSQLAPKVTAGLQPSSGRLDGAHTVTCHAMPSHTRSPLPMQQHASHAMPCHRTRAHLFPCSGMHALPRCV